MESIRILNAVLLVALPCACSPQERDTAAAPAALIRITTAEGSAEVPARPAKVAVYDYAVLDTVTALGVHPAVVPEKSFLDYLDQASAQAVGAGTIFEPDQEALHAARPDLIMLGLSANRLQHELKAIAPTVNMSVNGSSLISDGLKRLDDFGRLFGKTAEAEALHRQTARLLADTRAAIRAQNPHNALVIMVNGGKLSAFGEASYFGWVYRELGIPIAPNSLALQQRGLPVSFEFLRQTDPDWLFVVDRSTAVGEAGLAARSVLDNPLMHQTRAWRQGHIVYLSSAAFIAGGGIRQIQLDLNNIRRAFIQTATH
ncbi:siderophore ABC transporter substrate-binding protein [Uruburuella testudinis]|uniref:Siderophore ABC transporter substrate-binding protein n=1 Tax=Uruburuella testudinis TaxID=1282863 RepID=A0ABY4DVK8_9NEIS|nr:siderophore ABC transporter substrate-binding protein [Uruburuella testudinis]UOO83075.1 siderophore ABC transporter substrate-binding protein [Uruburuella testudinis]